MNGLYEYLKTRPNTEYPKRIQFETNHLSLQSNVDIIIQKFKVLLGYKVLSRDTDTLLEYVDNPRRYITRFVNGRIKLL